MDTTTATRKCPYCSNGTAEPNRLNDPRPRCLVCDGSSRVPAPVCPVCDVPMLDHEPLRYVLGQAQHAIHGATWTVVDAEHLEAPCMVRDLSGAAQPTHISRVTREGDEVVLNIQRGGLIRVPLWKPVDTATLR